MRKRFKVNVWHSYKVLKTSVLLTLIYCLKLKLPSGSQNPRFLLVLLLLLLLLLFLHLFLVVEVLTDHVGWSGDASAVSAVDGHGRDIRYTETCLSWFTAASLVIFWDRSSYLARPRPSESFAIHRLLITAIRRHIVWANECIIQRFPLT